jgi:hypothetical protein
LGLNLDALALMDKNLDRESPKSTILPFAITVFFLTRARLSSFLPDVQRRNARQLKLAGLKKLALKGWVAFSKSEFDNNKLPKSRRMKSEQHSAWESVLNNTNCTWESVYV